MTLNTKSANTQIKSSFSVMSVLDSPNSSVLSVRDDGVAAQRARMRPQLGP